MDYETLTAQSKNNAAVEAEEFNLFSILRPKICIDGDQWCVLYGDNLQDGVAGFGRTPRAAVYDFNKSWDKQLDRQSQPQQVTHD